MSTELSFEKFQNSLIEQTSLTPSYIGGLMESCLTCCYLQKKTSGSTLKSYNDERNLFTEPYCLNWDAEFSDKLYKTYRDEKKATENGAVFLSLRLLFDLTEYKDVEVSEGNNGIDYWLSKDSNDLEFSARLEVSGIRKQTPSNNIKSRLQKKIVQTKRSDVTLLPAYISIIEFSELEALIIER